MEYIYTNFDAQQVSENSSVVLHTNKNRAVMGSNPPNFFFFIHKETLLSNKWTLFIKKKNYCKY